ncbi:MAG TPA: hypothetical protein VKR61_13085 [Bryobacteraceae bacterium]|nr:hypothetical protein [Bryobacteraceae bacterium]
MRLRLVLPALMIGTGMLLSVQTPALAKTSYKQHKIKKYKASRHFKNKQYKDKRFKTPKVGKHTAPKHV